MKFLQDKTPADRNKTIAAMVLGFLALVALSYTFLFSGSSSSGNSSANRAATNQNSNSNSRTVAVVNNANQNSGASQQIQAPEQLRDEQIFSDITPIPENPFLPVFADQTARNIFAFYEPPPPVIKQPVPVVMPVIPSPSPQPTPWLLVQYANPQAVYARQGDFTLEVGGDKFTPDAKILFNGVEVPTQFQGANRLTAQIPAALVAEAGQRQILVSAPEGKFSNVALLTVNAPPVPNYSFVGIVARKRVNNDTATLQEKSTKQYQNVRLGETVGRFKVVSISSSEVVMQDTQLNFRHNLAFADDKSVGKNGGAAASRAPDNGFPNPMSQPEFQPGQTIPGIPGQYTFPQPQLQPMPQPTARPADEDEDDNGDN